MVPEIVMDWPFTLKIWRVLFCSQIVENLWDDRREIVVIAILSHVSCIMHERSMFDMN